MKKLMFGASVALMLAASSCSKCCEVVDNYVDKQVSDSISICYGQLTGGYVLVDYTNFEDESKSQKMKEDVVNGLRMVVSASESKGELIGMQIGVRMMQEMRQLEEQGMKFDKNLMLKNFIEVFMGDSIDSAALSQANTAMTALIERVQEANKAAEEAKAAQAPEAQQNALAGKAYIDKLKAEDPEVKVTESGLAYKVTEVGDGSVIDDNTVVVLNYKGSLIDGTVFDQSPEGSPASFSPSGVIPGFKEGLKLLSKGAKATLYIPGELAYGVKGAPQAGIGPNQTLIFDIEIVDIKK